ncbi:uncharacterized protein J4E78_001011 [Alternaria triticimaculans]|uniref:uncharacterized protein n=1 Tax=Alternaria triticimaculans TaxID=297637 RepID=UPI0020C42C79|nr:uncharacterized protein J4E78_001011 [Alternaria triticimaculans]KAI4672510.1 hypothetical protein J4E78_001011 [Alternaria triticimaculans]KAI4709547.1 hypothetical protein J4E89_005563 [Alternaria sp. Ai002NY15]
MEYHALVARQAEGLPVMPARSPEYMAENQAGRLMAVEGSLFALSTSAILLRFYVRLFMLKTFGWDDAMMAIALALSSTTLGLFLKVIDLGLGLHAEAFPLENVLSFFKVMYFYSIFIIAAYSFIKLSIGFFLLRLADRTKWRPFLIAMLINIATDLLFALIPIPMVWKLQVTIQTRIGLAVILSLGLFASAVAIYKTPMQYNFFKITDWSGDGAWYYIWQQVEMHVGIIAACLPTMKPLFANFFGQMRSLATKGRTTGNSTPFRSNGYMKHDDMRPGNAYAMRNMSGGSQSTARDPYSEDTVLGKDTYTCEASRGRALSRPKSLAGESDDSILEHEVNTGERRSVLPRGMTIVRTTEVNISR